MSRRDNNEDNFNAVCKLFCHLASELEKGGYQDLAEIVNQLMYIWLDSTLIK